MNHFTKNCYLNHIIKKYINIILKNNYRIYKKNQFGKKIIILGIYILILGLKDKYTYVKTWNKLFDILNKKNLYYYLIKKIKKV